MRNRRSLLVSVVKTPEPAPIAETPLRPYQDPEMMSKLIKEHLRDTAKVIVVTGAALLVLKAATEIAVNLTAPKND